MFDSSLIEKFKTLETPFFYYDTILLRNTLAEVRSQADKYKFQVHYALKANVNDEILKTVHQYGLGADCVSGNEVRKAIEIGFDPHHIVFAGVGKSDKEINMALQQNIFCFNCESVQEIEVINELAAKQDKIARIAIRINPNVEANTHKYITTGMSENKFGVGMHELDHVLEVIGGMAHIKLTGIHFHIGSQIRDLSNFKSLSLRVNELQKFFDDKNIHLEHLNVGGGLGIDYIEPDTHPIPDFAAYFKTFGDFLQRRPHQEVHFELGRAIVGQCGNLVSRVLFIKKGVTKQFVILDAGMTELIRPALYQAYHRIENLSAAHRHEHIYDVVGPICESSDCFARDITLPETHRGDLIAIRSAGAYGEVMTSFYNLRDKAQAIYE